jgi:hypothetical protein
MLDLMSQTGEKAFIVNTDRAAQEPDYQSEKYMLKHQVAPVTGEDFFPRINRIEENDKVFLWANRVGIVARGIATGPATDVDELIDECPARCVKLSDFDEILPPIKFCEVPPIVVMAAVNSIRQDKAQKIWDIASGRLNCQK